MTECAYIICSKSIFSYWGELLNTNESKKVLYPATISDIWYKSIPRDWITVSVLKNELIFANQRLSNILFI